LSAPAADLSPNLQLRAEAADLLAEHAFLLDEDRLEDWVELFVERADYRIVARENFDLGLPQPLVLCENKDMLRDRVASLRNANIYNIHRDRHIVGLPRFGAAGEGIELEASFACYQTDPEGTSRLFVAGTYRAAALREAGRLRFARMLVLLDTAGIPTLLSTPL